MLRARTPIIRHWPSKISIRWINCNSCGIKLQDSDPAKIGFYIKPKLNKLKDGARTIQDLKYLLLQNQIDNQFQIKAQTDYEGNEIQTVFKKSSSKKLRVCKRCNDAVNQNHYDSKDFKPASLDDLLILMGNKRHYYNEKKELIPLNLIHLVSLHEFPFHFEPKLFNDSRFNTSLIFTKCDHIIRDKSILSSILPEFFQRLFKRQLSINVKKILGVSSIKGWHIKNAFAFLKNDSYLIGNPNVGKSTFINAITKKYFGIKFDNSSKNNILMNNSSTSKEYLNYQLSGVSHIPNLTQNLIRFDIMGKTIYDLPGYINNSQRKMSIPIDKMIRKKWLDTIRKTELFKINKLKKQTYISYKGTEKGSVYTIGGIFYLKAPANTINQIIKFIPGEQYIFSTFEHGIEVFNSCNNNEKQPLDKYCGITKVIVKKEQYVRHVIPPFQGSIEIVIKDIGYFKLKSTGKYKYNGLYEIYLPYGMEVCIREPLEKIFLTKNDDNKKINLDKLIFSNTYEMSWDEKKEPIVKMREMYLDRTKNDILRRGNIDDINDKLNNKQEESPNIYWYYLW